MQDSFNMASRTSLERGQARSGGAGGAGAVALARHGQWWDGQCRCLVPVLCVSVGTHAEERDSAHLNANVAICPPECVHALLASSRALSCPLCLFVPCFRLLSADH